MLLSLILALAPVVADLDLTSTAGVIAGIAAIAAVALKWLQGWQQYEGAAYQADLLAMRGEGELMRIAAETEAAAQIGGPRSGPRIQTPRR